MNKLRWGILSTAAIARENWRAIRDSGDSVVTAVASRDAMRSRKFIDDCQREAPAATTPAALGSYEALLASREVDAVYIPLPTGLRKEWVLRAAAAGKHVLCEKPCGLSVADVREMTEACQKNRVQFMDGVMFMHNPRLPRLRELLDDGKTIGPIRRIMSVFSFGNDEAFFDANIRVHSALEPTGCLGDLGWYCIRFALWAMNWTLPREVTSKILSVRANRLSPSAVPADFFRRIDFRRRPVIGILLQLPRPNAELGPRGRRQWLSPPARFCFSRQHPRAFLRGQRGRRAGQGLRLRLPTHRQPRPGPGLANVPQLRPSGCLWKTQRRLADVGFENAAGHGCLPRFRPAQ